MKLLVVGMGSIGQRHVRNLRELRDIEILVYRRRRRPLPENLRGDWLREFDDLDAALDEGPVAALICAPPTLQVESASRAVEAGCHLFIEKPISDRLDGLEALVGDVERRSLVTLVGYNLRFHPQLLRIHQLVTAGRIGRVTSIRAEVGQYLPDWHPDEDYREGYSARRNLGGGAILDLIHEIDYVQWLGGPVSRVACFAERASELAISVEDTAEIILDFEAGAIGSVHVDYVQRTLGRNCKIIGDAGTIVWNLPEQELRLFEISSPEWQVFHEHGFESNTMYVEEMRHFLDCIEGRAMPVVNLRQGVETLRVALAARESADSGRVVEISR
jgi:predicted dehydrogenase